MIQRLLKDEGIPRPGLRGSRMPNSINVPATDLLDGAKYLPVEQLKAVFEKAGRYF